MKQESRSLTFAISISLQSSGLCRALVILILWTISTSGLIVTIFLYVSSFPCNCKSRLNCFLNCNSFKKLLKQYCFRQFPILFWLQISLIFFYCLPVFFLPIWCSWINLTLKRTFAIFSINNSSINTFTFACDIYQKYFQTWQGFLICPHAPFDEGIISANHSLSQKAFRLIIYIAISSDATVFAIPLAVLFLSFCW